MRRGLVALVIALAITVPVWSALPHGSFAQSVTHLPQGDEFNNSTFNAPFVGYCAPLAAGTCPDPSGPTTWNLNNQAPGYLRIWTQYGTLEGGANNARNLFLQNQIDPNSSWTITTKVTFPAATSGNVFTVGQTAGLIALQDQDNFIYVGRVFQANQQIPTLEFLQETAGVDTVSTVQESSSTVYLSPLYLRLTKLGNTYTGFYSYDNVNWTQFRAPVTATATATATGTPTSTATATATATPLPAAYTAAYSPLSVGVFAYGGTATNANNNLMAADFDWFRVGDSTVAAATATATSTPVPSTTATSTPTATGTATATATPTNTPTPTPTNTPVPTQTPIIKVRTVVKHPLGFSYVSLWYHPVHAGQSNHLQIQANKHVKLGIWVHMFFPSGKHLDWYTNTDNSGFWSTDLTIPSNVTSSYGDKVVITFQLWHGKHFAKRFLIWPVS